MNYVKSCYHCQTRNIPRQKESGQLHSITANSPWEIIGMDFMGPITPMSEEGQKYIIVLTDYFTKWVVAAAVGDATSKTVQEFVENIFLEHGSPVKLITDRGQCFIAGEMPAFYKTFDIKKANTSAYHPQTDGQTERINKTIADAIAKMIDQTGNDWAISLKFVVAAYNGSVHASTGSTPFFLLHGREKRLPIDNLFDTTNNSEKNESISEYQKNLMVKLRSAFDVVHKNIAHTQEIQKFNYDKQHRKVTFKSGDLVALRLSYSEKNKAPKFSRQYREIYQVVKAYDNDSYDIEPFGTSPGMAQRFMCQD